MDTVHECDRRTDRQTDGRTDRITITKTVLRIASDGNKTKTETGEARENFINQVMTNKEITVETDDFFYRTIAIGLR